MLCARQRNFPLSLYFEFHKDVKRLKCFGDELLSPLGRALGFSRALRNHLVDGNGGERLRVLMGGGGKADWEGGFQNSGDSGKMAGKVGFPALRKTVLRAELGQKPEGRDSCRGAAEPLGFFPLCLPFSADSTQGQIFQ